MGRKIHESRSRRRTGGVQGKSSNGWVEKYMRAGAEEELGREEGKSSNGWEEKYTRRRAGGGEDKS